MTLFRRYSKGLLSGLLVLFCCSVIPVLGQLGLAKLKGNSSPSLNDTAIKQQGIFDLPESNAINLNNISLLSDSSAFHLSSDSLDLPISDSLSKRDTTANKLSLIHI